MWIVIYDRHHLYALHKISIFRSRFFIVALAVFHFWKFCFLMSSRPVKQVTLQFQKDGVVYLEGYRWISERAEQLKALKEPLRMKRKWFNE